MTILIYLIIALIAAIAGVAGTIVYQKRAVESKASQMLKDAEAEGEVIKKEKMLQAKEKFLQLKSEHEKSIAEKNSQISQAENRIKQKEGNLNQRLEEVRKRDAEFERHKENLQQQIEANKRKGEELEKLHHKQVEVLEKVAGVSKDQAMKELVESLKNEARTKAMQFTKEVMDEAKVTADKQAKKVIVETMQRVAHESAVENAVTVFNIENDEIKGRIIGREGRNIRKIEEETGVSIIVDDTPEAIILSCFDPVRREIARLSLHQLVSDGRIHPARIEEIVEKTKKKLEDEIFETGKRTCIDLGIHGLNNELIRMVGRMKYRSSYGQNLLQHSREVANLCMVMAGELGMNAKAAKRAGLLHDIGKVSEEDNGIPHAIYGSQLAEKFNERPEIVNAIGAHHDEMEMKFDISPIIQICDAISGARPGARREIAEAYSKRIKELENLALTYPGVNKAFAIQAGRELRIIVESEKVSDQQAGMLAFDISQRIENEMTYPGQVKVVVIREYRAVGTAK